ncbi:TolC family protein, partial [bacterium]|nr:TolC family protein [bacterium]
MKKYICAFFIALLVSVSVFAEPKELNVEKVELSFEQAYALMLNNNNSLKAYDAAVRKSKYEKKSAVGQFFPKVVLNSTYIHFSDNMTLTSSATIPGLPLTATANTLIQDKNLFTIGGGVIWNVFTGGKLLSNNAAAREKVNASNSKYNEILDNLTLDLVKRYYGLRLARDVVEVRKLVYDGLEAHLRDAKLLEEEGIISKAERLHAEVAFSEAQRDYKAA